VENRLIQKILQEITNFRELPACLISYCAEESTDGFSCYRSRKGKKKASIERRKRALE
jgi:hypothetical protein